jgi:hypothetical protein
MALSSLHLIDSDSSRNQWQRTMQVLAASDFLPVHAASWHFPRKTAVWWHEFTMTHITCLHAIQGVQPEYSVLNQRKANYGVQRRSFNLRQVPEWRYRTHLVLYIHSIHS